MAMSLMVMGTDINALSDANSTQNLDAMMNVFTSKDILNSYNLYNIGVSLLYVIFLSAPVYRRLTDIGFDSKRIKIRHTPELRFIFDDSIEYGNKIEKLINDINNK